MKIITTNEEKQYFEINVSKTQVNTTLSVKSETSTKWEGFGGSFNELSQKAVVDGLDSKKSSEVYDLLFSKDVDGLKFDFCRIPIGASDYAEIWYSHNEVDGDYAMKNFSIERDKKYLLPYIKEAQKRNPKMRFFASPWSPPSWMKTFKAYNYGTLVQTKENLDAYALYFALFIEAYEKEGVIIDQLHIQNEPSADQKFPSCVWTGHEFANFIKNHLAPLFKKRNIKTKIWLGTLNSPEYNHYGSIVLQDKDCYDVVEGVSYQWAGKHAIAINKQAYPEKKYIQSENECGDGRNTWWYANYVFDLFRQYISNGVCAYVYWNMMLPPKGNSTWGWSQNSMIDITNDYKLNYEFFVMKHFSAHVLVDATVLELSGALSAYAVGFKNPNGKIVLIARNPYSEELSFEFENEKITLPINSINTILL